MTSKKGNSKDKYNCKGKYNCKVGKYNCKGNTGILRCAQDDDVKNKQRQQGNN